jgi:hypothetical protein
MNMGTYSEKYERILRLLRNSEPELNSTEDIQREVIKRISKKTSSSTINGEIIDLLFGWIYIGWVRRSLITASVLLVMVFVWQQSVILKQINFLSKQIVVTREETVVSPSQQVEKLLTMYKSSSRVFPSRNITISEKQLNQLLESVNELKVQYKDLIELIDENPELKKYIENKLIEKNNSKIKL